MKVAVASETPVGLQHRLVRSGQSRQQLLFADETEDGLNFRCVRSMHLPGDEAFASPRHHHGFQQLRWAEKDSINFAPGQDIGEGELAYFPRGAWYGPQLKETGIGTTIQFGFHGESQFGPAWSEARKKAEASLEAAGTFADGIYTYTDQTTGETCQMDSVQALYEAQYEARYPGQKFSVPPEGYDAPILMHPEAFEYYRASPGVEVKHLGCFFDHPGENADVRLSMIRLSADGHFSFGADRAQLAWAKDAGLQIDDKTYPELTYIYVPRGETLVVAGDGGLEVHVLEFPRLD